MNIPFPVKMCERLSMNVTQRVIGRSVVFFCLPFLVVAMAVPVVAETTNAPTSTNSAAVAGSAPQQPAEKSALPALGSHDFDQSAFRIVVERNIFDANRSGGQVRLPSRRPSRVESFTLVGTMAYDKGAFAFFNGSSSEYSQVIKAGGVIAGHKVADVLSTGVKLEADGKILELPIGSAMRREDEGTWHLGNDATGGNGSSYASNRENDYSSRSSRSGRSDSRSENQHESGSAPTATSSSTSNANESEILKRLMERREKESQ